MQVQIMHENAQGQQSNFGIRELSHMPPVGEPFSVDRTTCYTAKAYFGPDEHGTYLLVLVGDPMPTESSTTR